MRTLFSRVAPVPVRRWPKPSQSSSIATPSRPTGITVARNPPARGCRPDLSVIGVEAARGVEFGAVKSVSVAIGCEYGVKLEPSRPTALFTDGIPDESVGIEQREPASP